MTDLSKHWGSTSGLKQGKACTHTRALCQENEEAVKLEQTAGTVGIRTTHRTLPAKGHLFKCAGKHPEV